MEINNNYKTALKVFILFMLLFLNSFYGIFVSDYSHYRHFQKDSEALVYGAIEREKNKVKGKYGLGRYITNETNGLGIIQSKLEYKDLYKKFDHTENIIFIARNKYTEDVYKENNTIKFDNGDVFKIKNIICNEHVLGVILEGDKKMPSDLHSSLSLITVYDANGNRMPSYHTWEYRSQFGLQGMLFSSILKTLPQNEYIYTMHFICSIITSIVLLAISIFICKKYNYIMGATFYCVFLLSPWITAFSRNAYWVEFTWFLPVLAGLICSLYNKRSIHISCVISVFILIFIKSLCGYEYISTIMMTTVSFLFFDMCNAIINKDRNYLFRSAKLFLSLSIAAISGFVMALCMHAYLRGDGSVSAGLEFIYKEDVLRRLHGEPGLFSHPAIANSLSASIFDVAWRYFRFSTEILFGMGRRLFFILALIPILIFIYNFINKKLCTRDVLMYFFFFVCSVSWLVLAKGHSYIHTHMNYVLWYFGFIQVCFYVIIKNINICLRITHAIVYKFFAIFDKHSDSIK